MPNLSYTCQETYLDPGLPNQEENGAIHGDISQKADLATVSSEFDTQTTDQTVDPPEPPRNVAEQMYCDHADCASTQPKFLRKQDWW